MSEQMKPCPFPHSAEDGEGNPADYPPSVVLGIGSKVGECWVECEWCGASGPAEATEAAAIASWNQRAGEADYRRLRELERACRYVIIRDIGPKGITWRLNPYSNQLHSAAVATIGRLLEVEGE